MHSPLCRLAILCLPALLFLGACSTPRSLHRLPAAQKFYPITPETFGGELPKPLNEYMTCWEGWLGELPVTPVNPAVKTALPPTASQLFFSARHYNETLPLLLEAMASTELNASQREFLQTLALLHQQQAILAAIYHAVDDLQHEKREAIPVMLERSRRLRDFQEKFQSHLPHSDAEAVLQELVDWLALWDGLSPLGVLPNQWRGSFLGETEPSSHETAIPPQTVRFSALYDERPVVAPPVPSHISPQIGDMVQNKWHMLWLLQDFPTPVVASERIAYLILPALHHKALIQLNGTPLENPHPGHPWAIPLTPDLLGDAAIQHIAIHIPLSAVGEPILPIFLASGKLF
ncbi:MAG: hypothetical protein IKS83_00510 [Victivallales bacterium]|nr:hypothetical protein [Victivallales bacterium]